MKNQHLQKSYIFKVMSNLQQILVVTCLLKSMIIKMNVKRITILNLRTLYNTKRELH